MVVFLDTSVLAKRYIEESGTKEVDKYFSSFNRLVLSSITPIEISSVFSRRLREKSLTHAAVQDATEEWGKERPYFIYTGFSSELIRTSINVVKEAGIKTLDAIQLASAYISNIELFVTADKALLMAAQKILHVDVTLIS